ncbi:hypothetical protein [Haloparvum sedimenti]|uniref:hypothetical protein n=1 Tax=Haloparvum sedimenti TaxID=1678448 RepID=UPI00071E7324|nr:hypothetical protein [Haloparvum sedimenti]
MRNHLRLLIGLLGVVELAAPRAVVRGATRVAYRESGDAEPRDWVYTAARIEGAVLTTLALVGLYRSATAAGVPDDEHGVDER